MESKDGQGIARRPSLVLVIMQVEFFTYLLLYLLPRFVLIFTFPIFNDEAINIHIGRFIVNFPSNIIRFSIDGRQPAYLPTVGLSQFSFIDPLVSARLMTLGFAFIAFIFFVKIAQKLGLGAFSLKIFILALSTSPFLILYDTLVLPEAQVMAASSAALWIVLYAIEKPTFGKGILLGTILAVGWWYFSLILLIIPGLLAFFLVSFYWQKSRIKSVLFFWGATLGTFVLCILPLLVNSEFQNAQHSSLSRTLSISQLLRMPWSLWLKNTSHIAQWMIAFVPIPLFLFSILGIMHDPRRLWRGLAVCIVVPMFIVIFIATSFSARNIVFIVPIVILLAVRGLLFVPYKRLCIALCLTVSGVSSMILLISPLHYFKALAILPAAHSDFGQYVTGWPSGYGIDETIAWFRHKSNIEKFSVVVRSDSGNPEDGMFTYLEPLGIPVIYPDQIEEMRRIHPEFSYYFVSRGAQYAELATRLTEVVRFKKPLDSEFVGIYALSL